MYSSSLAQDVYPLTLSTFKKVNGEWGAVREEFIEGRLEKYTLEIKHPFKLGSAFQHLQEYFNSLDSQLLFDCDGLSCGSSNAWANERFGVKQLFGLDSTQHYQVWRVQLGKISAFVSLYLVQRGNHRVYLQLENLFPVDPKLIFVPGSEVVAKEFYREKEVEIMGLSFYEGNIVVDNTYMKSYARAFNQQSHRKLVVTAYDAFPGSESEKQQRSQKYAEVVFEALEGAGVHRKRMTIHGVGEPPADKKIETGAVFISLD